MITVPGGKLRLTIRLTLALTSEVVNPVEIMYPIHFPLTVILTIGLHPFNHEGGFHNAEFFGRLDNCFAQPYALVDQLMNSGRCFLDVAHFVFLCVVVCHASIIHYRHLMSRTLGDKKEKKESISESS